MRFRLLTHFSGTLIGVGATAEVYTYGADVVKLHAAGVPRDAAAREGAVLDVLERAGVPAPRNRGVIEIGGRWGLVMTRATGRPFGEAMLADGTAIAPHLEAMVDLQRAMHALPGGTLPSLIDRLRERIARAAGVSEKRRRELIDGLADMPDSDRLCHGDFHPFNILGEPGAAVVIDWVDAARGSPMADVCRSYVLMLPHSAELADDYVTRYCTRSDARRDEVLAWLPYVAAARLCENISENEVGRLRALAEGR